MSYIYTDILIIDEVLYVSFECLVHLGIPVDTIKSNIRRTSPNWVAIPHPQDARKRLIAYEPLRTKYKQLVVNRFGDPYTYVRLRFIDNKLVYRDIDWATITEYRTDTGLALPKRKQLEYKESCGLLAYLDTVAQGRLNRQVVRAQGFDTVKVFWESVYQYIKGRSMTLPASRRIKTKLQEYRDVGAYAVIHSNYSNSHRTKIDDTAQTILVKLMRDQYGRKFSKKEVWRQFRSLSKQHNLGLDSISYVCLWSHINATEHLWYGERHGQKEYMLNKTVSINQRKVSQPHLQWQIDGTQDPLWYYDEQLKTINKLYSVVVMDSHSDAIVGYSLGTSETQNLVFSAIKMAIQVHSAKPHELRSDKGSANTGAETKNLLRNLGVRFKPSKVGNARARTVEREQGHWMKNVLTYFKNKSGQNITAGSMDSRQNSDKVKANYKDYPRKAELIEQLHLSFQLHNHWEMPNGGTRKELLEDETPDLRTVNALDIVELFYVFRRKGRKFIKYPFTIEGISMQVSGKLYRYVPQTTDPREMADFFATHENQTKFYVKYDPSDLSQIALYVLPDGKEEVEEELRFLTWAVTKAKSAQYLPEATDEEKEAYRFYRQVQREQQQRAIETLDEHEQLLESMNILNGGIDMRQARKEEYNKAKLEVDRLRALGHIQKETHEQQQQQYLPNTDDADDDNDNLYDDDEFDFSSLLDL